MLDVHRELVGTFTDAHLFLLTQRKVPRDGAGRPCGVTAATAAARRHEAELAAMELERRHALERGDVWPAPAAARCAFCEVRDCFTRIVGPRFDEVACPRHVHKLEAWADDVLPPGAARTHTSSSARQVRGSST